MCVFWLSYWSGGEILGIFLGFSLFISNNNHPNQRHPNQRPTQQKQRHSKDQCTKDKDTAETNRAKATRQQRKSNLIVTKATDKRQSTKQKSSTMTENLERLKKSRTAQRTVETRLNNEAKKITDRPGQNVSEEELIRLEQISTSLTKKHSCTCQT